jgi:hypothetical protein
MVWTLTLRCASYSALVSLLLLGLVTTATAQQATEMHFNTAITQVYGSKYPLTGRLDLEVFPTGTVRGFYHTSYYKLNIPVVGGKDGNYIWLDIGPSTVDLGLGAGPQGRLHVVGSLDKDGSFSGQVYPETAAVLSGPSMQAQSTFPNPGPTSNDQYLFSATPVQPAPVADPTP